MDPSRSSQEVSSDQVNGGRLGEFTSKDWNLILLYLEENERLFRISVKDDLLDVPGRVLDPSKIYRKIEPIPLQELA